MSLINKFTSANKQSSEFFSDTIKNAGNDIHKMVGYSEFSHLKRFEEMMKVGPLKEKSLLDVGCGPAAFYSFLHQKAIFPDYYGIDINDDMIKVAGKMNPELQHKLFLHDIISHDLNRSFDYIVCIGILNLDFGENINDEMTKVLLKQLYKHADIGFGISMTSSLSTKQTSGTYYYKLSKIIEYVSEISNNFSISHSYLPNDFTLFCYKKNSLQKQ
jgi:ubiquinone/menaquinone biosynthesis C-methylase UbiE